MSAPLGDVPGSTSPEGVDARPLAHGARTRRGHNDVLTVTRVLHAACGADRLNECHCVVTLIAPPGTGSRMTRRPWPQAYKLLAGTTTTTRSMRRSFVVFILPWETHLPPSSSAGRWRVDVCLGRMSVVCGIPLSYGGRERH